MFWVQQRGHFVQWVVMLCLRSINDLNSDCQRDYYEIGCTELPQPVPQGHIHTVRGHCDVLI